MTSVWHGWNGLQLAGGVVSLAFQEPGGSLPNSGFAVLNGEVPSPGSSAIDLTESEIWQWMLRNMRRRLAVAGP